MANRFDNDVSVLINVALVTSVPEGQTWAGGSLSVSPNPAVGARTFGFSLRAPRTIDLAIYDLSGRRVAAMYTGFMGASRQNVTWIGKIGDGFLTPGLYVVKLRAGADSARLAWSSSDADPRGSWFHVPAGLKAAFSPSH